MERLVKTKDSDEAAFLWTLDKQFTLSNIETVDAFGNDKKIAWFCFVTTMSEADVEALRTDYRLGKCMVEPRRYSMKRNEIKSIIRERCFGSYSI